MGRARRFGSVVEHDARVRRTTTASGVRVVTDSVPEANSVSVSAWVGAGSRDEPADLAGACHFLEHLLFKGTRRRRAHEINVAIDTVGGEFNAVTAKESTAFVVRVPADDLRLGAGLLCEVLAEPLLDPGDIEAERGVILEELAMVADSPDEAAASRLGELLYPGHGLGWEVLGRDETLARMGRAELARIWEQWYLAPNLVIAAAGRLDHEELVEVVEGSFPRPVSSAPARVTPSADPVSVGVDRRDTEQVHLAQGWLGTHESDPDRFALAVLLHALGDGPSSRLYRKIRDERGLAYSVYTAQASFSDSGMVGLYCGTTPGHLGEVRRLVEAELADVCAGGITDAELEVAVGYLSGSTVLALEDPGTRMARLGAGELSAQGVVPVAEVLDGYASVEPGDVVRVARRVLGGPTSVVAVGPVSASDVRA